MSRAPVLPVAVLLSALLAACPKQEPPREDAAPAPASASAAPALEPLTRKWDDKARTDAVAAGVAAMKKHQCTRCHVIDALEPASRPLHCVSCHQFLKGLEPGKKQYEDLTKKWGKDIIDRYQKNITHLMKVPDLTGLGRRVKASWIEAYVQAPHDLRPLLEESMIRNVVDAADAKAIARYFAAMADAPDASSPETPDKPDEARLAQGKALFTQRGCATCHTFGNVPTGIDEKALRANTAALLAPNLRYTRERMRPDAIVPWILDPKKLLPSTTMPPMGLTPVEAQAVAAWLLYGDPALAAQPKVEQPAAPKPLDRPVAYEEVKERVLGKVCVHCHMNDYEKDPGPGNLGGLGFAGIKLRMRTYETLVSGAADAKGERYSVLVPRKGEKVAPIVTALLRRRVEAARDQIAPFADHALPAYEGAPGMPLGLPAMTDEEIALLVTWIDQGCKGPTKITGVAGVNDGYLVPDGPIEKNAGCELRAPSKTRPAWAKESEAKSKGP